MSARRVLFDDSEERSASDGESRAALGGCGLRMGIASAQRARRRMMGCVCGEMILPEDRSCREVWSESEKDKRM